MARMLAVAAAIALLPVAAAAQDALSSAPLRMGLPSASLDRVPLGASVRRDLFRATPTTFAPGFEELPPFDPRFPCCGFAGPVFASAVPWWAAAPHVVYVPVIVREVPVPAPAPAPAPPVVTPPPPAVTPPAPGVPKTFYVIPRCYAGDRPPERATLAPGCDIARLRTIPPVVK